MSGVFVLIIGPMFSGKTTELLKIFNKMKLTKRRCVFIKYYKDMRYNNEDDKNFIITHDKCKLPVKVSEEDDKLQTTILKILDDYDIFFIDELQFYEDGHTVCDYIANSGKAVYASGLQGDSNRLPFLTMSLAISYADKVIHLTAIDTETGEDASFTYRSQSANKDKVLIGGNDIYIAVSRQTYMNLSNNENDSK